MTIQPIYLPATISNPIAQPFLPELPHVEPPSAIRTIGSHEPKRVVVLVSGVTYPHHRGKLRDGFGEYCKRIAPTLNTRYPNASIRSFSFYDGKQYEFTFDAKGVLAKPTVIQDYGVLNKENYRYVIIKEPRNDSILTIKQPNPHATTLYFPGISDISATKDVTIAEYLLAFEDGTLKERSISMRHVYEFIAELGKSAPSSLAEFHIFSHAFEGGPILANTSRFEDAPGELIRDQKYLDKDCRVTDFTYFATFNTNKFSSAFAKDAYSVVWGCLGDDLTRAWIKQIRESAPYKSGDAFDDRTKRLITIKNYPAVAEDEFHEFFMDEQPYSSGETEKKSIDDLKKIFNQVLENTYASYLYFFSKRSVRAALPGTAANLDNERTQTHFGLSLMHIFMGSKYLDPSTIPDYRKTMEFYKKVLGIRFEWIENKDEYDKEYKRGYGVYE